MPSFSFILRPGQARSGPGPYGHALPSPSPQLGCIRHPPASQQRPLSPPVASSVPLAAHSVPPAAAFVPRGCTLCLPGSTLASPSDPQAKASDVMLHMIGLATLGMRPEYHAATAALLHSAAALLLHPPLSLLSSSHEVLAYTTSRYSTFTCYYYNYRRPLTLYSLQKACLTTCTTLRYLYSCTTSMVYMFTHVCHVGCLVVCLIA